MKFRLVTNPDPDKLPIQLDWRLCLTVYLVRLLALELIVCVLLSLLALSVPHTVRIPPALDRLWIGTVALSITTLWLIRRFVLVAAKERAKQLQESRQRLLDLIQSTLSLPNAEQPQAVAIIRDAIGQVEALDRDVNEFINEISRFPLGELRLLRDLISAKSVAQHLKTT